MMKQTMHATRPTAAAPGRQEDGFIMIVTLMILVVLTLVCMSALDNSTFEVRIAANDRQSRAAFNLADGSVYSVSKIITETIDNAAEPDYLASGLIYLNLFDPADPDYKPSIAFGDSKAADIDKIVNAAGDFSDRVHGFADPRADGKYDYMLRSAGVGDVFVRIEGRNAQIMAGGGAGFAEGAQGAGVGSSAGTAVTFDLVADAFTASNARSTIEARYRKVLGGAGGL